MSAFDHFQMATCDIADGNNIAAVKHLEKAIAKIDADGVDAHMRDDLVALRDTVAK